MPNYWASRSVLSWMSEVWNSEIRNMVLLSTFGLLFTCFLFWISFKFDVCMIEKTTVLFSCIYKQVKSIFFAVFIKFCNESGLAILNVRKFIALDGFWLSAIMTAYIFLMIWINENNWTYYSILFFYQMYISQVNESKWNLLMIYISQVMVFVIVINESYNSDKIWQKSESDAW